MAAHNTGTDTHSDIRLLIQDLTGRLNVLAGSGNMALTAGLYYVQDYTIYLCTRDTVNPVYNAMADLIGLYVEKA